MPNFDELFDKALAEAAGNDAAERASEEPPTEQFKSMGLGETKFMQGRLYTTAPQERVERAYKSAETEWKAYRKRKADEAAKTANYRYSVKCRFCKAKWMEDFSYAEVTRVPVFGLRHHCTKIDGARPKIAEEARYRCKQLGEGEDNFEHRFRERWSLYNLFVAEPVRWKDTGAPTECGARCMNATGPNCDCRCKGKNHGANKVA